MSFTTRSTPVAGALRRSIDALHIPAISLAAASYAPWLLPVLAFYTLLYLAAPLVGPRAASRIGTTLATLRGCFVWLLVVFGYASAPLSWSEVLVLVVLVLGLMLFSRRWPSATAAAAVLTISYPWVFYVSSAWSAGPVIEARLGGAVLVAAGVAVVSFLSRTVRSAVAGIHPTSIATLAGASFLLGTSFCFFHESASPPGTVALATDIGVTRFFGPHPETQRRELVFVTDDCDGEHVFVGFRSREELGFLARVSRDGSIVDKSPPMTDISDNARIDCATDRLYVADPAQSELYAFDRTNLHERRSIRLGQQSGRRLILDLTGRIVVTSPENTNSVDVVDTFNQERSETVPALRAFSMDWTDTRTFIGTNGSSLSVSTIEPDGDLRVLTATLPRPCGGPTPDPRTTLAADTVHDRVFVVCSATGELVSLEGRDLRVAGRVVLDRGIRYVATAPSHDTVLVGDYIGGNVWIVEGGSLTVRRRVHLGSRVRWVEPSKDGNRALVAAHDGVWSIDLRGDGSPESSDVPLASKRTP